ncbi:MAG: radical SAM protein [Phycisphaeraceae bacterium]
MLSVSNLLSGHQAGNEALRYGHTRRGERNDAAPGAPRPVVVWAVTKACNLRCVHCYASADPHAAPGELTHAEGKALLEDLACFEVPAVLFSGGEPLARPDTPDLIGYARQLGLNCTLSTNGLLIDDAMADRLVELGLRYVGISLDGTRARHDKLRGMRGAYEGTLAAIDRCQARGMKVGLRFTVHALNEPDLEAMFDLCLEHGVQRLCIYHLAYAGRGGGMQKVDLSAEATRHVVDRIFALTRRCHQQDQPLEVLTVGNHADAAYTLMALERDAPEKADAVRDRLRGTGGNQSGCHIASIDPLGQVHYDQFSWHYTCGSVREQPFSAVWREAGDQRLAILRDRRTHLPMRCQQCQFLDVCNGNLRTRAEAATGDWLGLDPSCYLRDDEITVAAPDRATHTGDRDMPEADALPRTLTIRVTDPPLELETDDNTFQPNPTTVRFGRAMHIAPGDVVFDIGTGIGPLAITAGQSGAARVIGVDPVPAHCRLARRNVARYGLEQLIRIEQGRFFEPFETNPDLNGLRADVIVGDVSGIADVAGRALGWYPADVPVGGPDGTDVILQLLEQAPRYLVPHGRLYFPVAVDLSDGQKIVEAAHRFFGRVENALSKPYVDFPLTPEQVNTLHDAYGGELPAFIQVQQGRRPYWRGQILVAMEPCAA